MSKKLQFIHDYLNQLLEKIPVHIQDIIQKTSMSFIIFLMLLFVAIGINRGLKSAQPTGVQHLKQTDDLFFVETSKDKNDKRVLLIEDVDTSGLTPEIIDLKQNFKHLSKNTSNHLYGEPEHLKQYRNPLKGKDSLLLEEKNDFIIQRDGQALHKRDDTVLNFQPNLEDNKTDHTPHTRNIISQKKIVKPLKDKIELKKPDVQYHSIPQTRIKNSHQYSNSQKKDTTTTNKKNNNLSFLE